MFDSGVGDGSGVPAQAETVAAPAPGSVDLLFDAGIRVLLTEVGDALAQAGVVGACVARPADQVALASALEPHRPGAALVELLEGLNWFLHMGRYDTWLCHAN